MPSSARQSFFKSLATALIGIAVYILLINPVSAADNQTPTKSDDRLNWWREARFGLFIHWGIYSVPAGQWNGQTDHGEWIRHSAQIPIDEYEKFLTRFNPSKFNAEAWVKLAHDAGMQYVVITTKHHDGFCLFDSKSTDFDVMSTPFKRDIMKEMSEACRRDGLRMCWYHSIMDWHHPDYLPRREWEHRPADGANFDRYVQYLHSQVRELLTNYGDIGVMWFDGQWERTWTHEQGKSLYELCRSLQPSVIVNNRVDTGRTEAAGMTAADHYGDFGTPEQEIPPAGLPGVDWETCMTMNDHWGFNSHDQNWKSSTDLIRKLVDIASKGGNFLLNVGPNSDGEFPAPCIERLRAIGKWMSINGQAIHGTAASPFSTLAWGRCTQKSQGENTILYLHVFDWPADGRLVLDGLDNEIVAAHLLSDPAGLIATRNEAQVQIGVPAQPPDPICSVIALEVRGQPKVYEAPLIKADSDIFVQPLTIFVSMPPSDGLSIRYTIDGAKPSASSPMYEHPITVTETTAIKAQSFRDARAVSGVAERRFTRVIPNPSVKADKAAPGLICEVFDGDWNALPDFQSLQPIQHLISKNCVLPELAHRERIGCLFRGFVQMPRDNVYRLAITSDDGSRLWIDGKLIVDNDGLHTPQTKDGTIALAAGLHSIAVGYFNNTGRTSLAVTITPAGAIPFPIDDAMLWHGVP